MSCRGVLAYINFFTFSSQRQSSASFSVLVVNLFVFRELVSNSKAIKRVSLVHLAILLKVCLMRLQPELRLAIYAENDTNIVVNIYHQDTNTHFQLSHTFQESWLPVVKFLMCYPFRLPFCVQPPLIPLCISLRTRGLQAPLLSSRILNPKPWIRLCQTPFS